MFGSKRQELRGRYGRLIGWRQYLDDGRIEGRDEFGRLVGTFDPRRSLPDGETFDRYGRYIGRGDLLATLIAP
jgi:hypothetical protein